MFSNLVQSRAWFYAFLAGLLISLSTLAANIFLSELNPGNALGLGYGIAAATLMTVVALFGLRRRLVGFTKTFGWGKSQNWVQFHVYAGTLFLLLLFMHTGFRWPNGALAWWLFILSIWVSFSGLLGVFLQKWIPKILTSGLSIEALYERIPELVDEIRVKTEKLIAVCADPVKDFYRKRMAASLAEPQVRLIYYIDITGGVQSRTKQLEFLRRHLSAEEKSALARLESYYKTKLELDAHYTLQKALRLWLYLHVPPSLALIVLVALHIYAILYY